MIGLDGGDNQHATNLTEEYVGKQEKTAWNTFLAWDKLLLLFLLVFFLSALAALFVLLTPLLDLVLEFMGLHFAAWDEWQVAIMEGDRGLFIAALLVLLAVLFALLARHRMRRDYSLYMEAGCPQCHENELIRVRRNRRDRALSFLGLPVRRYSCRNCTWHGLRLAGYRYDHKKEAAEDSQLWPFDQEAAESQGEFADDAAPAADAISETPADAEIQEASPILEENAGVDPVEALSEFSKTAAPAGDEYAADAAPEIELTAETTAAAEWQQPSDGIAPNPEHNSAEISSDLNETAVNTGNAVETELVSATDMSETAVAVELDNDSALEQEEPIEQTSIEGKESVDIAADHQLEDESSKAGAESDDQDDDFDRLCFEVAMSKK